MEKRTARINLKIRPSLKAEAEKHARDQGRTLSNYIELLITRDIKNAGSKKC